MEVIACKPKKYHMYLHNVFFRPLMAVVCLKKVRIINRYKKINDFSVELQLKKLQKRRLTLREMNSCFPWTSWALLPTEIRSPILTIIPTHVSSSHWCEPRLVLDVIVAVLSYKRDTSNWYTKPRVETGALVLIDKSLSSLRILAPLLDMNHSLWWT